MYKSSEEQFTALTDLDKQLSDNVVEVKSFR